MTVSADTKSGGLPPWLLSFAVPAIGGSLFGYDIGASSSVLRVLGEGTSSLGALDSVQLGLIGSGSLLGAVIASASIAVIGDSKFGRKSELLAAACIYGAGSLLQATCGDFNSEFLARILYGVGIGTAMHVAPLYIAETAPNQLRGQLVSLKEACIVAGIVMGYGSGAVWGPSGDWQTMFSVALPVEALMLAGALALPESPRWLALRGREEEAVEALAAVQGLSLAAAQEEVAGMVTSPASATDVSFLARAAELIQNPVNRAALGIGVGLVLFQQLSGQPSVLYYANRIFDSAGLGFEAAVGVGVFKCIMTLVSVALVEKDSFGRRPLLLAGTAGMSVSLAALTALFATAGGAAPDSGAVIACIVAYVGFYQIGFGPLTWLILSEIFPLAVRGTAVSVATLVNFSSNFFVSALFEWERERLGEAALFGQFTLVAALSVYFVNSAVFETKGLSLEQIEAEITRRVNTDKS